MKEGPSRQGFASLINLRGSVLDPLHFDADPDKVPG